VTVANDSRAVLLLTVGTGDRNRLEETLLTPLAKSIEAGPRGKVILVPSLATVPYAETIRQRFPDRDIEIRPIPQDGDEYDPDRSFAWIDGLLAEVISQGYPPEAIVVDFTRGTKSMSAAATLAGVSRGVDLLRYVDGVRQQDPRGMVQPGTERMREVQPALATVRALLQRAMSLIASGQFAAAASLFPGWQADALAALPEGARPAAAAAAWFAAFWGDWDRFFYASAAKRLAELKDLPIPAEWMRFLPSRENQAFLELLAQGLPEAFPERARHTRYLAADLLANAERRLHWGQPEDALQRAYRVLESAGQARLFAHGLDSECVDATHPGVAEWLAYKEKQGKPVGSRLQGKLTLGREQVASLLKRLKDPMGRALTNPQAELGIDVTTWRNLSILNHGFASNTEAHREDLQKVLGGLRRLLLRDPDLEQWTLDAARFQFAP